MGIPRERRLISEMTDEEILALGPGSGITFTIEGSYSAKYKRGAFRFVNGRRYIRMYEEDGTEFVTTLPRYRYSVYLYKMYGIIITDKDECDHIDNDPLNDRMSNYQLLTHSQNMMKMCVVRGENMVLLVCPFCQKVFHRQYSHSHLNKAYLPSITTCNRTCSGKANRNAITQDLIDYIRIHQILYVYRFHYFNPEDNWCFNRNNNFIFGDTYGAYAEILERGSRELIDHNPDGSIRCKDIPGITEYCWDILTPIEEQTCVVKNLIDLGYNTSRIADYLKTSRSYIADLSETYLGLQSNYGMIKERNEKVLALLDAGQSREDIMKITSIPESSLYCVIRDYRPELREFVALTKSEVEIREKEILELVNKEYSIHELANRFKISIEGVRAFIRRKPSLHHLIQSPMWYTS
jgi:uncharacterized C2H2 Zn-finger protein/predicted DNA-binding protein YlxM (UPF0122 family)